MINNVQLDLLKKHVGPFLFCFFTVMFILLMQFLILHVDKLVGKGLPFFIVIELILNNLAYMVVLAVPMAVLVSTLMAFGRFSEWNELTALKAAGVNPFSLMKPVLAVAVVLFIGLSYFSNNILPESNHKARSLFIDIRMQKPGFDLQPGVFYDGIEGYTFLVREMSADSDTLRDITLFQEPGRDRHRSYIKADTGWLDSPDQLTLSLHLRDGMIVRYIPGSRVGEETVERSQFSRHRISFDLSDLAFSRSNPEQRNRNDRTMSAQAMLSVIDTLRTAKENEFQNHLEKTALVRDRDHSSSFRRVALPPADSVNRYHSGFKILNEMDKMTDWNHQSRIITESLSTLSNYRSDLDNLETNLEWRDLRIAEYMVEVYKKFSIPFACIIFVLVGAPIGMMTKRGNIGFAAITAAVLLTFYFIAIIQGEKWADRIYITPFMGMWGINLLLGIAGILLTLKVSTSFKLWPGGK
ncbi:MAG: LptF/LptG family permease [Balneolaceae bacterium]